MSDAVEGPGGDHAALGLAEELIRLTAVLASERDQQVGLAAILSAARRLVGAEGARILVVDRSQRRMHCVVAQGGDGREPRDIAPVQLYGENDQYNLTDPSALAAITGRLVHVGNLQHSLGSRTEPLDRGSGGLGRSLTVAPLWGIDRTTLGVLQLIDLDAVRTISSDRVAEETAQLITTIGSYAAVAIALGRLFDENSRLVRQLGSKADELERENSLLKTQGRDLPDMPGVVAGSSVMRSTMDLVRRAAGASVTVLLLGETGTGKDVLANCIHRWSERARGPFIAQNCAAMPENLLESELFGFKKGAFSGAMTDKPGLVHEAHGGTLFLDEIGDMPLGLQAKILRVLEDGTVRRLGDTVARKIDVRIVAATNADLSRKIVQGLFREDLYYRLSAFPIFIPPLRERYSDIPRLIDHFVNAAARANGRKPPAFTEQALDTLSTWKFPGNLRELRNILERAVLLVDEGERIDLRHLPREILAEQPSTGVPMPMLPDEGDLKSLVRDYEARVIESRLREVGWNQTRAARRLKISRRSLIDKLERYAIRPPNSV